MKMRSDNIVNVNPRALVIEFEDRVGFEQVHGDRFAKRY
jgi:hypothetical protein